MHIDTKACAGFGVAGNFANHLEQAGESEDFVDVQAKEGAPKGMFAFYLPNHESFLGTDPFCSDTIVLKSATTPTQVEPEVAIVCDVVYEGDTIKALQPTAFTAYNDCSLRQKGVPKISMKKNWGAHTKGIANTFVAIDRFDETGVLGHYDIASFIKREGVLHAYGEHAAVNSYSYNYGTLIEWMTQTLNTQTDHGPLEDLNAFLRQANHPKRFIISIGATRYTHYGETHYLQEHDEVFVVLFDRRHTTIDAITQTLDKGTPLDERAVLLHQKVIL